MKPPLNLALVILLSFVLCQISEGQNRTIDSLKKVLLHQQPDTNKALTYVRLSEQYIYVSDIDHCFLYSDSAFSLAKKLSFKRIEASALENRGAGYMNLYKFDSARIYILASMNIREKIGDKRGIAQSYNTLGYLYSYQDSIPEALENFYISLKKFEEIGNRDGISAVRLWIANIYLQHGNDSEALVNVRLAWDIQRETRDYTGAINSEGLMGDIEFGRQHYDSALKYYRGALQWNVETGFLHQNMGWFFIKIGDAYQKLGEMMFSKGDRQAGLLKYKQAMTMYDSSKKLAIRANDSNMIIYAGMHIAKIELQQKNFSEARKLLNEYTKRIGPGDYSADIADVYASLSFLDSAEGNFKKAYVEYKTYIRVRDSVTTIKNNKKIARVMMQHQFDVRDAEAKLLQDKKDAETLESRRQQNLAIFALAIVILAVLAIALTQMRNNNAKQRANKLLEKALTELKSTQTQLIQSEKLASLGELTAGIAHEIQNPLNFVNNFSDINKDLLRELKDEMARGNLDEANKIADNIIENEQKINHHGQRADGIVKGMLQHSQTGAGKKELTNINTLADEYLRIAYHGLRAKDKSFNASLKTNYDKGIGRINVIPQEIGRVLLNLYNNAFYAVHEKAEGMLNGYEPTVTVSTGTTDHKIEVRVRDNGNGIPSNLLDKIFQPFFTTKPAGQGTGLGLSLSYDIIKAHGETIEVQSREREGAEFLVQIPVA
jgi:two-component system, NtrC family, sensor kinase